MGEEIDPLVIQRTQQKLGKYIQRPQLTDKLLKRPPFRFIHDIITGAINQYGILENVFTKQELVSENIKEKEEKIAFLQKLIFNISSELGQDLNVKPSKIVAGIEAERTNDLLQALALVLENKQNSKSQRKNTLANESKNNGLHTPTKAGKPSNGINKPSATNKKSIPTTSKENGSSKSTVKTEAVTKQAPDKTKDVAKPITNKPVSATKPASGMSNKTSAKPVEETKGREPGSSNKRTENNSKPLMKPTQSNPVKPTSRNTKEKTPPRTFEKSELYNTIPDESPTDLSIPPDYSETIDEPMKDTYGRLNPEPGKAHVSSDYSSSNNGISLGHVETGNSNKGRLLKTPAIRTFQDEGVGIDDTTDTNDSLLEKPQSRVVQLSPPQANILNAFEKPLPNRVPSSAVPQKRPPSGSNRPKSSRRPPSRTIRDRLSVISQDSRPISSQVPRVIIEGNPLSDDEEDRIVQAAVFDQATADLSQAGADELLNGEQGKLVEQILLAQKEWDPLVDTDSGNKDNTSTSVQVQHLKAMIQEMAQAALPLGQLIPLIHEDMETVQQEWQFWKREADLLEEEYHREKMSVDSNAEKLQAELEQLDRMIRDHQVKLNMTKATVLKAERDVSLVISNFGKKR